MSSSYNTIDSSPGKWTGRIFVNNISHVVEEILRKKQALTTTRGLDVSDGEDGTLKIQLANYLDKSRNSREAAVIAIGKWFARHNMSFTTAPDGYEAHLRSTLDKFFNGTDTEYHESPELQPGWTITAFETSISATCTTDTIGGPDDHSIPPAEQQSSGREETDESTSM
ncbi:hypothetical protein TREMEDRAFT_58873 [Tremella mesenterica DSM 1558]|uniref:uncharacterized protein n=1 Tax=Tremella mesenterica (strain ATCC 24925 / CBS 8224 / DSM 1558 / NBRC 9311 / NRRL Y-6157 / RJB 2259-6 / UBC 559-6) TaxID=578456 RepID=UPI0003F493E7|nr:uncharacterized protein TREMEDRAFT_58873 [Tremella mesenterica DSM 1558]EIW72705.1 hypothetical protein TREMEDRAFT_58873 [Tremella mesenterica DSM 1558]